MALTDVPTDGRPINWQFQRRRCGRPTCKCMRGEPGHGPYWYAGWINDRGERENTYVGKTHPEAMVGAIPLVGVE